MLGNLVTDAYQAMPEGSGEEWANRAILDEQGQITEYQGMGRDITERKRAEEALRESELGRGSTFTVRLPLVEGQW
jgi:PAS domain-containing protein